MREETQFMAHRLPEMTSSPSSMPPPSSPKRTMADGSADATISRFPTNRIISPLKASAGLIRRTASDVGQLKPVNATSWSSDFREGGFNANDIFRAPTSSNDDSSDEKQSRNESSLRLTDRSDGEAGERQQIVPQDRLDRAVIFRRSAGAGGVVHSPIGTPRDAEYGVDTDSSGIPSIRPSLSCPTSVFESPLFQNSKILSSPGGPLEEVHSSENSSGSNDDLDALNCTDVSVIEYDEEPSFRICEENTNLGVRNLNDAFDLLVVETSTDDSNEFILNGDSIKGRDGSTVSKKRTTSETDFSENTEHKSESTTPALTLLSKRSESTNKPSPTSVVSLGEASMISTVELENGVKVAAINMPHFNLHNSLRGVLSQGLIDRVSFYSIVRDINKEALDAAMTDPRGSVYNDGSVHGKIGTSGGNAVVAEDGKIHVHPNPEEESKSVLVMAACLTDPSSIGGLTEKHCISTKHSNAREKPTPIPLGAALLDEEWWLLSAVASRDPEEVVMNKAAPLPPTFSEAMGEKEDPNNNNSNIDGKAVSSSRTQLWKPGRSWWEAKSGKNPWVEPVVHNNRWRYLWPLIHYHKFVAKCIKKLKRNGVDVKNSSSNVSAFLRQEVCNVSDHLAAMSKFDSEEWTSALSHFDGWTAHDPDVEEVVRNLVACQQLHGVSEMSDLQSSLLRSQVDEKFLKAMQAMKEEAAKGVNESYDYSFGARDAFTTKIASRESQPQPQNLSGFDDVSSVQQSYITQDGSVFNGTYQHVGGHCPVPYVPNRSYLNDSHARSVQNKMRNGADWSDNSDLPPPYPHPNMYGPPIDQQHQYDHSHAPGPYAFNGAHYYPHPHPHPHPHQFGPYNQVHHHHDGNMGYHHGSEPGFCIPTHNDQFRHHDYYSGYYPHPDASFHPDGSFHDASFHDVNGPPYMHSSSMAQTPSRYQGNDSYHSQYPLSPYWGHLNISQLPGLAASPSVHHTPSKPPMGKPNRSFRKRQGNGLMNPIPHGKEKPLLMFGGQTNSPASRFAMNVTPNQMDNSFSRASNLQAPSNVSQMDDSFHNNMLPAIEYYDDSPSKSLTNMALDAEETKNRQP